MSVEWYEKELCEISRLFDEARNISDDWKREARMQYLGAYLRMLESMCEFSKDMRNAFKQDKEVC